jgi:hypothetical protein
MVAMQYIAEKKLKAEICVPIFVTLDFFLRCANARTFRSAKRQNTQLCCIASIFTAVFHILFH